MKLASKILPMALFAAICVPASAATVELTGGTSPETAVTFGAYDNTTILKLLTPVSGTTAYFNGDGRTINSLTVNATDNISAYITGGFTADIAAASGTAIYFGTASTSTLTLGGNSSYSLDSSTTTASATTLTINLQSDATQANSLIIESGSTLSAFGNVVLRGSSTGNIPVTATSGLIVNGTVNVYGSDDATSYGNLQLSWVVQNAKGGRPMVLINNGGQLNVNNLTFAQYGIVQVANGGTLNATGTLTINSYTPDANPENKFIVDSGGTANLGALTVSIRSTTGKALISGALTVSGASSFTAYQSTSTAFEVASTGTYSTGSLAVASGYYTVSGALTAGSFSISRNASLVDAKFYVNDGGVMNVTGATTITSAQTTGTSLLIQSGGKFTSSSIALSGGTVTVSAGGELNATSGFTFANDSSSTACNLYVYGTANIASLNTTAATSSLVTVSGGTLNLTGTSSLKSATITSSGVVNVKSGTTTFNTNDGFVMNGSSVMNISSGATVNSLSTATYTLKVNGIAAVNVYGTGVLNLSSNDSSIKVDNGGTLTINSENSKGVRANKITMFGNSKLIVSGAANTFADASGNYTTRIVTAASTNAALEFNASTILTSMQYQGSTSISLKALENVIVEFSTIILSGTGNSLSFTDFRNHQYFFTSMSSFSSSLAVSGTDYLGNAMVKSDITFVAGEYGGISGYWLASSTIPEPAAWAAILGAVVLGFAAWRRRK